MIDLGNRKILEDGTVICDSSAMIELLFSGRDLSNVFCSDPQDELEWIAAARTCDDPMQGPTHASGPQYQDVDWFHHWLTPEPWASMDVREWCHSRCKSQAEHDRVDIEIDQFEAREMMPVMRHLLYAVDTWRDNGVVWGVGRGSSVCSFVLHLIGINRINPLEHGLDIDEWLK